MSVATSGPSIERRDTPSFVRGRLFPARPVKLSFEIDKRITLMIDFDLAVELGQHLQENPSDNPAINALMIGLLRLEPQDFGDDKR